MMLSLESSCSILVRPLHMTHDSSIRSQSSPCLFVIERLRAVTGPFPHQFPNGACILAPARPRHGPF